MTEKKAEPAYIITESELRQIGDAVHEYGIIGAVPLFLKIRSRPHNPAPAIISVEPHPPGKEQLACDNTCPARCPGCEDTCPLWQHDEQVKREAREEVLNEICAINKGDGCCNGQPHGKDCFDCAFIHLRSEVKKE